MYSWIHKLPRILRDMLILNFTHPLTPEQLARIEELTGQAARDVRSLPAQFDPAQPFAEQAAGLAERAGLSPAEWQTLPILIVPPALNFITAVLLAELHGRMGHFPSILRLRPVPDVTPPRYEVAEIINLQAVRDATRGTRQV